MRTHLTQHATQWNARDAVDSGRVAHTRRVQTHRLEAISTRTQYNGSEVLDVSTPYSGTWQATKKISNVRSVQMTFSRKAICGETRENRASRQQLQAGGEAWQGATRQVPHLLVRLRNLRQDAHHRLD